MSVKIFDPKSEQSKDVQETEPKPKSSNQLPPLRPTFGKLTYIYPPVGIFTEGLK